jgi:hypothetical protein
VPVIRPAAPEPSSPVSKAVPSVDLSKLGVSGDVESALRLARQEQQIDDDDPLGVKRDTDLRSSVEEKSEIPSGLAPEINPTLEALRNVTTAPNRCPCCGWQTDRPFTTEVTQDDKIAFLLGLISGQPMYRTTKLYGGLVEVEMRSLTSREADVLGRCLIWLMRQGLPDFMDLVARMNTAFRIVRITLKKKENDPFIFPDRIAPSISPGTAYWFPEFIPDADGKCFEPWPEMVSRTLDATPLKSHDLFASVHNLSLEMEHIQFLCRARAKTNYEDFFSGIEMPV